MKQIVVILCFVAVAYFFLPAVALADYDVDNLPGNGTPPQSHLISDAELQKLGCASASPDGMHYDADIKNSAPRSRKSQARRFLLRECGANGIFGDCRRSRSEQRWVTLRSTQSYGPLIVTP
jgi:hypothetical protein